MHGHRQSTVYEVLASNGNVLTINSLNSDNYYLRGLAIDPDGTLYYNTNSGSNVMDELVWAYGSYLSNTNKYTTVYPAIDGLGDLYIAYPVNGTIVKAARLGGYFVNKPLPAGLTVKMAIPASSAARQRLAARRLIILLPATTPGAAAAAR